MARDGEISGHFTASAGRLYFWTPGRVSVLAQLPRHTSSSRLASTTVATLTDGTIKRIVPIPGGVAVLVSSRVHGQGWTLTVAWPKLTVGATDFVANPARAAVWVSPDGGGTWSLG